MKFWVTFKSPDGVASSISDQIHCFKERLGEEGVDPEEIEERADSLEHEMQAEAEWWFRHGEYAVIELDTKAHTARVVKP